MIWRVQFEGKIKINKLYIIVKLKQSVTFTLFLFNKISCQLKIMFCLEFIVYC